MNRAPDPAHAALSCATEFATRCGCRRRIPLAAKRFDDFSVTIGNQPESEAAGVRTIRAAHPMPV